MWPPGTEQEASEMTNPDDENFRLDPADPEDARYMAALRARTVLGKRFRKA